MDAGQDLHQRRLAGAVLPDERHDLAEDVEADVVERDDAGESALKSPTFAVKEAS